MSWKKSKNSQNQACNEILADKVWMIQGLYKPLGFPQLLNHSLLFHRTEKAYSSQGKQLMNSQVKYIIRTPVTYTACCSFTICLLPNCNRLLISFSFFKLVFYIVAVDLVFPLSLHKRIAFSILEATTTYKCVGNWWNKNYIWLPCWE